MGRSKVIKGTRGNDNLVGTEGKDKIFSGKGDDVIDAGAGNDLIFSGAGNDTVDGGAGHDCIHSGKGDDIVNGGEGNDYIHAGKGDDTVTGGAGDDFVHLGKGNDTAIYVMGDNVDSEDFYHGGRGQDTLRLEFTKEEWLRADIQADIAAYLAYLNGDDVPDEYWHNRSTFEFKAFNLTAKQFENLAVVVDGEVLDPADQLVDALDDLETVTENSSISGNVLTNDNVPDLVASVELVDDVAKGILTFNPDGSFTYDTNGEFEGLALGEQTTQTFTYKVIDADGDEDSATVTITITGENDAPIVSVIDGGTTDEDASTVTINLLSTATDADGSDDLDTENVMVSSNNAGRTVLFLIDNETGSFTVDPSQFNDLAVGESETLTVSYNVTDGNGGVIPNTATLIVKGRNDVPTVTATNPDAVLEGNFSNPPIVDTQTVDVFVQTNINDPDTSDTQSYVVNSIMVAADITSATTDLSLLTIDQTTGEVSYDRNAFNFLDDGESAIFNVTYDVQSGPDIISQTIAITILGENDAPFVRRPLLDPIDEDTPLIITKADFLSRTTEFDQNDQGSLELLDVELNGASAPYGTLVDNGDDTWTFTPSANFFTDQISPDFHIRVNFKVFDGTATPVQSDAQFEILPVNDAPTVIGPLEKTEPEDGNMTTLDLLSGVSDVENDTLTIANLTNALPSGLSLSGAILTINPADASFQHLAVGDSEIINLSYDIEDGNGGTVAQTAKITITGTNDLPEISSIIEKSANEDDASFVVDLLAGASDPDDGETATLSVANVPPLPFGLTLAGNSITVDPSHTAFQYLAEGIDEIITVNFDIEDAQGGTVAQTANITITGTNDLPEVASIIEKSVNEDDGSFVIDLLEGASDPDDGETQTLSVANISGLEAGLVLSGSSITVDPKNAAFQSLAVGVPQVITVNYDIVDAQGDTVAQTAKITIKGTNDLPEVASIIEKSANEDDAAQVVDLLPTGAITDIDTGDVLSVVTGTLNQTGGRTLNSAQLTGDTLTYSPGEFNDLGATESEALTFTYDVTDSNGGTVTQTINLTIEGVNDAPVVTAIDAGSVGEDDAPVIINLLNGQTDPDANDVLSVENITAQDNLGNPVTFMNNNDGTITIDPNQYEALNDGENRVVTVTYDVADGTTTTQNTANLEVIGATDNLPPDAVDDVLAPVSEFLVNEFTNGGQLEPSITALSTGGFVVTWYSFDPQQGDTSSAGIKARIFNADGTEAVSEFLVNEFTNGSQNNPSITALSNGGFVVTWTSQDPQQGSTIYFDIKARIFDATGTETVSEFLVNEFTNNSQLEPSITALSTGGFVVTWSSNDPQQGDTSSTGIKARIFDASGTETVSEFLVNEFTNSHQNNLSITALSNGGFVVTWYSNDQQQGDTSGFGIKARIFDATGTETVSEFLVNEFTNDGQFDPSITALSNGGFVVTWYSNIPQPSGALDFDIKARIFDANGTETVSEFLVNEFANGYQLNPSITALSTGGFVVTWSSDDPQQGDMSSFGIKARIFDANGNPQSSNIFFEDQISAIQQADLLANDTDPDGDPLTITEVSATSTNGATVTLNNDGTISYDPTGAAVLQALGEGEITTDNFTYTITDGNGEFDTATVTVTVLGQNDTPVAIDDAFAVSADQVLTVTADGVLANDTDIDTSDTLSVSSFEATSALGATVTVNQDGSLSYDATGVAAIQALGQGETQDDTFAYTIEDGNGGEDTATVTVTVTGVNEAPVAMADAASVDEDGSVLIDVLDNDSDVDGDVLTITNITDPAHGTAVIENGQIRYTPNGNFSGVASFAYTISDGKGGEDTATVTININEIADEPTLTAEVDGRVGVDAAQPLNIMAAITDLDGSEVITQIKVSGLPAGASLNNGTVSEIDGSILLNPSEFDGDLDGLLIQVEDPTVTDFTLTIEATVTDTNPETGDTDTTTNTTTVDVDVNAAPVAEDLEITTNEDTTVTIDALASASDPDGDDLTLELINTSPQNGTVEIIDSEIVYTPNAEFSGQDSFDYRVSDGFGGSSLKTVTVNVTPDADTPTLEASLDGEVLPLGMAVGLDIQAMIAEGELNENPASEQITQIKISGLPAGVSLSAGVVQMDGSVLLDTTTDLAGLTIIANVPPVFDANFELSSLDGSNGFVLNGIDTNDQSGISVSGAGDVNGDGIDDLIIGAYVADENTVSNSQEGESYVVFGKNGGFNASFELSSLLAENGGDGSNGFVLNGIDSSDLSGYSVSGAGDINGDGIDDLIIGAPSAGGGMSGESYVVFGSNNGFSASFDLSTLNGINGFTLEGIDGRDGSGWSVSGAGDINGDGIEDLIIGARSAKPGGKVNAGESYVVFGSNSGFSASFDLSTLNGINGFTLEGIDALDESGRSVSGAGDVNGDGIDDLIIGARHAEPGGDYRAGESYVVFGSNSRFEANLDLSTLNGTNGFTLEGIDIFDGSGWSVSSAGDINGDGIDDLIIGARSAKPGGKVNAGESYVVFGSNSGFSASFDLSTLNGTNGFTLEGIDIGDANGWSVSGAGDINGDGIEDLIIGAPEADLVGGVSAGESYVVFGSNSDFSASFDLSTLNGTNGFTLEGIDRSDGSGWSVSGAGDINGDGIDDLIIGARGADPDEKGSAGESYVVFGRQGLAPEDFQLTVEATVVDTNLDNPTETDTTTVSTTLDVDVNQNPVIEAASFTVDENQTEVGSISFSDPDGDDVTIALTENGTTDNALFEINAETGHLTFITAPDFENPQDIGLDNIYDIEVQVSDEKGGSTLEQFQVTIDDVGQAVLEISGLDPFNLGFTVVGKELIASFTVTNIGDEEARNIEVPDQLGIFSFSNDFADLTHLAPNQTSVLAVSATGFSRGNYAETLEISYFGGDFSDTLTKDLFATVN
jgi:VCBS repeat-containing protein